MRYTQHIVDKETLKEKHKGNYIYVCEADMVYVSSLALLELTSMLDTHNILYTRRRSKRKHEDNYICV